MSKFNKPQPTVRTAKPGALQTAAQPTGHTYEGGPGYEYDTLSQLFLLACSNMVGEDTFYENGKVRDARYAHLIDRAVSEGHSEWLKRFFPWLRNSANMRSAAVMGAVAAAKFMVDRKIPGGRQMVNSVLVRADEPGEALAWWINTHRRSIPKPIKRGIADAVTRLYTERNALKYDTASHGFRFGDVIELVHPSPATFAQGDLFKWLLARGHKRDMVEFPETLPMIQANGLLRREYAKMPVVLLNTARLSQAGMTWEDVLSLGGSKIDKKMLWQAMIPNMGYMALLRNLRNFDEAGIAGDMVAIVNAKLRDPSEVARSRQLPMRFLSAYRNVPSNRWAQALEEALDLCLKSVPTFTGRTLILIDTSGSMSGHMSGKSQLRRWDAAAVFGLALAARCEQVDVVSYAGTFKPFPQVKGESLLKSIARFEKGYFINGGTATAAAVQKYYGGHDRVVILTDEQAHPNSGVFRPVPADKMAITFNLAGYANAHAATGHNRVTIGGLSDAAFTLLASLESRRQGMWPF